MGTGPWAAWGQTLRSGGGGRRDYGVGPIPNRGLAADALWRGDRPLGGMGTDPAVGMSFASEFDLIVKI